MAVACCASACMQEQRAGCVIKGNISSSGERIYHVPGQRYYDKTVISWSKGERWFCTEQEAVAADWRKAITSSALRDWPAFGAIGGGAATRWPFVMDRQPYPRSLPRCARALSPHDPGCEKRRSKSPGSKPFHGRSPRSREERQQQSAMHNANQLGEYGSPRSLAFAH